MQKSKMGSFQLTRMNPCDEIKLHFPILRAIFDCLSGTDLMTARLIDSSWWQFITYLIQKKEGAAMSPLEPIDLSDADTLQCFLEQFPEEFPPMRMNLLHFANIKLCGMTPVPELTPFVTIHGQHLKFLTLSIPRVPDEDLGEENPSYETIKFILNNCPGIETLSLKNPKNRRDEPPAQNPGVITPLNPIGNLRLIKTKCRWTWAFIDFLHDLIRKSPNLESMKGIEFENFDSPLEEEDENDRNVALFDFFKSAKHVVQEDFKLLICSHFPGVNSLLQGIREIDINIQKLHLTVYATGPLVQEIIKTLMDALGKLESLQELTLWRLEEDSRPTVPLRLPPALSIRKLQLNSKLDSPILESQGGNLEHVQIIDSELETFPENPFSTTTVFPKMKELRLAIPKVGWKFAFPNLESLLLSLPAEAVGSLATFLTQFPTLVNLDLNFCTESHKKHRREAWWDLFTGGSRPVMTHVTPEDVILGKVAPIIQNHTSPPLQVLPNLKRLTLRNNPEVISYAIVHLSATRGMPKLQELEFVSGNPEIQCYLTTLEQYHAVVSIFIE